MPTDVNHSDRLLLESLFCALGKLSIDRRSEDRIRRRAVANPSGFTDEELTFRLCGMSRLLGLSAPTREHLIEFCRTSTQPLNEIAPSLLAERLSKSRRRPGSPELSELAHQLFPSLPKHVAPSRDPASELVIAEALSVWVSRMQTSVDWNNINADLPEAERMPIDDVWLDVRLVPPTSGRLAARSARENDPSLGESSMDVLPQTSVERNRSDSTYNGSTLLRQLSGGRLTLVVGEPGSGKTTLAKYIARQIRDQRGWEFSIPIFVPLKEWSASRHFGRANSILRWWLEQGGCPENALDQAAQTLRERAAGKYPDSDRRNILLILDGWDEIAVSRDSARAQVESQIQDIPTVLTSRPSGLPEVFTHDLIFELVRLSSDAIQYGVSSYFKHCKDGQLGNALNDAVNGSLSLQNLASSPFSLHILCRLVHGGLISVADLPSISRATLYQLAIDHLIRQQRIELSGQTRVQLESLAAKLTFREAGPKFLFRPTDVLGSNVQTDLLTESVTKPRILTRSPGVDDQWYFLHASVQEYLAARHMVDELTERNTPQAISTIERYILRAPWDQTFRFVASLKAPRKLAPFWAIVERQLDKPDLFDLKSVFAAALLAEVPLADRIDALADVTLKQRLWAPIFSEACAKGELDLLDQLRLEALLEMTPDFFMHALRDIATRERGGKQSENGKLIRWARRLFQQHTLIRPFLRQISNKDLQWLRDQGWLDDSGPRQSTAIKEQWRRNQGIVESQLAEVSNYVTSADVWMVPYLIQILRSPAKHGALIFDAIECLGKIGGIDSSRSLFELTILDDAEVVLHNARTDLQKLGLHTKGYKYLPFGRTDKLQCYELVEALRNSLDPQIRDEILWEIACRPAEDPVVKRLSDALLNVGVFEGIEALFAVIRSNAPAETRVAALSALTMSADPRATRIAREMSSSHTDTVRAAALRVLINRVPEDDGQWLTQIAESDADYNVRSVATATLASAIRSFPNRESSKLARRFIERLLEGFAQEAPKGGDSEIDYVLWASKELGRDAVATLERIANDAGVKGNYRLTAIQVLGEINDATSQNCLLRVAESLIEEKAEERLVRQCMSAIGRRNPLALMRFDVQEAKDALRVEVAKRRWFVYEDGSVEDYTGAQIVAGTRPDRKDETKILVGLSGGGMRATFFHLGIFLWLAENDRLKDVTGIVSVSGGSILSGHFAKHWEKAIRHPQGFCEVAAGLIQFARKNLRDRVLSRWLWSRLLFLWFNRALSRSEFLRRGYKEHFGETTLGDLHGECRPQIAIVATDAIKQERVAFMANEVIRIPLAPNSPIPAEIKSKGIELSLAVAASSCFPPVFSRMHLDHLDLNLPYRDFQEKLSLNDGGVAGNLGIEVLLALRHRNWSGADLVLVGDAQRPQTVKPSDSIGTDMSAQAAAFSQGSRDILKERLGEGSRIIAFAENIRDGSGLPFNAETKLFGYRTDLDCPTWQELHGLMIHGALAAAQANGDLHTMTNAARLRASILKIIESAGGPQNLPTPTAEDFRQSHRRPRLCILIHLVLVVILMLCILGLTVYGASCLWHWLAPTGAS